MNHAEAQRNLRKIQDPDERYREWKIKKVQTTFDLDRNTAAQTLEWIELKFANQTFAAFCGAASAAYVHWRLSPVLQARSYLFKKPWMVPLLPMFAGYCGYHGAKQLRGRRFAGVQATFEKMSGSNDVISRFRHLDNPRKYVSPKERVASYLQTCAATSRTQVEQDLISCLPDDNLEFKNKQIKRLDKDLDDLYWHFGRIHGLENIAFVDDKKLEEFGSNPIALQMLINEAKPTQLPATSFDGLVAKFMCGLDDYKQKVNKLGLNKSDRSKLLALPFFTMRRIEGPAPKKGQWQYELFTELAGGREWDHFDNYEVDPEKKITIYDYEKFLPASYLEHVDTNSEEFKKEIKLATLLSETQLEKHQALKEKYRDLMKILSVLTEKEGKAFVHLLKNKHRDDYLETLHGGEIESKLAKISEKENYLKKNRYLLEQTKINYRDKSRMSVDKAKIKDIFRHAHEFKDKMNKELGLYDFLQRNVEFEKQLVQPFIKSAKHGSLKKLKEEVGLDDRYATKFLRVKDIKETKESWCEDPILDHSLYYFMSSYFLPLNMTDYEEEF